MDFWTLTYLTIGTSFAIVELTSKFFGRPGATFSSHCWHRWFPRKWQRGLLGLFGGTLFTHLVFQWNVVPFAACSVWLVGTVVWKEWTIQRQWNLLKKRAAEDQVRFAFYEVEWFAAEPFYLSLWRF